MSEKVITEKKSVPQRLWAKFYHWYGSYAGKTAVNTVYSAGASVVIIGAMFKIMHFPGAGPILMMGMITESFLFLIGVLEKPHPEYNWDNVFPQLLEYGAPEQRLAKAQQAVKGGASNAPTLTENDMQSLREGIKDLAKTASQLSELGTIATSTTKLGEKMDAAASAADQFIAAGQVVGEKGQALSVHYDQIAKDMSKVAEGTKACDANMAAVNKQLNNLNAIYELHLQAVQSQTEAFKTQTNSVNTVTQQTTKMLEQVTAMAQSATAATQHQQAYEVATKKLASQVAELNKIYGSMLSALA